MYCTKCGKLNPDSSRFCSECGTKLVAPPVQPPVEQEQAEKPIIDQDKILDLLFEAFRQFESGQPDEALKTCEQALKLNPSSTSVHSLLSVIYQRQGDVDRAISEVERVLELNPNSAADRERLDQLKHRPTTEPKPPTMLDILWERVKAVPQAALVAAAAVFVVVCLFVLFWPRGATPVVRTVQPPVSVGAPGEIQATAPQQPYTPSQPVTAPYPPAYRYTPPPAAAQQEAGMPQTAAAKPVGAAAAPAPQAFPQVKVEPRRPQPPASGARPVPSPRTPGIEITTSPQKQPPPIEGAARRVESATLLEQAREAQMAGNYDEAIQQYQQALRGATNPAAVYQQIAVCQQRLGRNDNAAGSYQSAIDAYKKQIAAGKNADEARRGLAAVEAGLKLVKGG